MNEFKRLISSSAIYGRLNKNAQSYLFCSFDPLAVMLASVITIENETGLTFGGQTLPYPNLTSPHPDIIILPESDRVLTADIESITRTAHTTPLSLNYKYVIIKNAHTMNDSSTNKLLKTLEEPPKHLKIFLLSDSENSVTATIRSRCQILRLDSLQLPLQNDLNDELHLNSITRLIKAQNGEFDQPLRVAINTLLFLRKSNQILTHIGNYSTDREGLKEVINMLELIIHDAKMFLTGGEIRLKSFRSDIAKITQFYNLDTLVRLDTVILNAKKRLIGQGNINSIADELLFSLLSTRQKYSS